MEGEEQLPCQWLRCDDPTHSSEGVSFGDRVVARFEGLYSQDLLGSVFCATCFPFLPWLCLVDSTSFLSVQY